MIKKKLLGLSVVKVLGIWVYNGDINIGFVMELKVYFIKGFVNFLEILISKWIKEEVGRERREVNFILYENSYLQGKFGFGVIIFWFEERDQGLDEIEYF